MKILKAKNISTKINFPLQLFDVKELIYMVIKIVLKK